jgi:nitrate/TMAO reductase-like tetraheme cytochrome c subunit
VDISLISRLWRALWRPSARYSLGVIALLGALAGIAFWGGFNTFMEYTNTLGFCVSCHEMRDNVYEEYRQTVHFKNPSGVRVVCSDCHVPREWTPKLLRKIRATNELYHHLVGTIDSPEKFNVKRLELAESVWATMQESDSRECRNCHSFEAMDFSKQRRRPQKKHPEAMKDNDTCIDCHKGVAHDLPEEYEDD